MLDLFVTGWFHTDDIFKSNFCTHKEGCPSWSYFFIRAKHLENCDLMFNQQIGIQIPKQGHSSSNPTSYKTRIKTEHQKRFIFKPLTWKSWASRQQDLFWSVRRNRNNKRTFMDEKTYSPNWNECLLAKNHGSSDVSRHFQ